MSKRNKYNEELETKRTSPYDDMQDEDQEAEYEADMIDQDESDYAYDEEEYEEVEAQEEGGFLSTVKGKILLGVIAALLIVLLALVAMLFLGKKGQGNVQQLPVGEVTTQAPEQTQSPVSIVFAPTTQPTEDPELTAENEIDEPTQAPVIIVNNTPAPTFTPEPTKEPEPTATPLPIIMSNTPTPSPTPTATPTPSPSPTPTPSPKPTATPLVDLANGETNRDAKLRESASASGKVKKTVKKGETVTIHEAILDKDGKVWYALTVDDLATDGFMRDYVIDVEGDIVAPTATPKATEVPKTTPEPSNEMTVSVADKATAEPTLAADVMATGKTNRDANMRKVMNGKVLSTVRKGKAVEILSVRLDKNGDVWYEVRQSGKTTVGFMRDYVVNLDPGAQLEKPEPTAAPTAVPTKEPEAKQEAEKAEAAESADESETNAIGKAKTNRDANIRVTPDSGAKLVRQLTKGNVLNIFGKYEDAKGQIWYEVATESGKTKGFVRDYVVNVLNIEKGIEAKKYEEAKPEESTAAEEKETARESRFKYAGDKESKVFHDLSCELLPSTTKNLVYMESKTYAESTGYTPCESCNP